MFGFLASASSAVGNAIGTAATDVKNAINQVASTAQNDPELGGLVTSTVSNLRTDLANALNDAGSGALNALTKKVGGANAPVAVPITASAKRWLVGAAIVVVILLAILFWRSRK